MAALDFLSQPEPVNNRPKKRPCLRWDDAGPPLFDDARLQLQLAFQSCSDFPGGEDEGKTDPCSIRDCLVSDSQQLKSHRLPSTHGHEDDEDGHFNYRQGDDLSPRYTIFRSLGEGTFGKVWECWDRLYKEPVAIKVVRSAEKYRKAAMTEVNLLYTLAEKDVDGLGGCVRIRDYFYHQNRVCIVCEKLGPSLFDFLRTNNYRPFSIDLVREFGRQILGSVAFMHSVRVIHTDLKPENVLLVSSGYSNVYYKNGSKPPVQMERVPVSSRVKLIDFGSATFDRADCFSIVSTRHYRAPEVILGLGWSFPCDIWSVGCILIELCSGEALFQTHENTEHLAMMERVLGPIPSHIIKRSMSIAGKYFRDGGELNWPDESTSKYRVWVVRNLPRLRNLVMKHADHSAGLFINLLEQLLKFDPEERPTASEALKHPFFGKAQREYDQ